VKQRVAKGGTEIIIGKPAKPMPAKHSRAVAKLVASIAGITEAHLPQCYIPGVVDEPGQVLFLVIRSPDLVAEVMPQVGEGLQGILSPHESLDCIPLDPGDELLPAVREAGCEIFKEQA
jgi:hypothetical protein